MARYFARISPNSVSIRAGIEAARSYIGPAEPAHEAGQPDRLARPPGDRDFQLIEHVGGGDALDTVSRDSPLKLAQRV